MPVHPIAKLLPLWCLAGACAEPVAALDPAPRGLDGIEEADEALADLTAQCGYATGVLTLTLYGGDTALVTKASASSLTINGFACGAATPTNVKRINVVEGAPGDETVILDYSGGVFAPGISGAAGVNVTLGGDAGDALKLIGTLGADSYVFGTTGIAINADSFVDITTTGVSIYVANTSDGNDTLSGAGNGATGAPFPTPLTLYGGDGDDSVRGGAGNDIYYGGNGNDTFGTGAAADGSDTVNGGANTDTVDYSTRLLTAVTVSIDGVADDGDTLEADDVRPDVETVKGSALADSITGSATANTLYGGPGADTLTGGLGDDVLYGDAGDDTFDEGALTSGADIINGGAGTDTVSYALRGVAVAVTLDSVALDGQAGELDKVQVDVENVIGGGAADVLIGSAVANRLDGGGGGDTVSGGGGDDVIIGGAGIDTLAGDAGDDRFDEGGSASGADAFNGGAGVDTVDYSARGNGVIVVMDGTTASGETLEGDHVFPDVENLIGGGGVDSITGNAADNLLQGGLGDDALYGLAGDDVLDGDLGNDTLDCGNGDADIDLDATTASSTHCEL